MAVGVKLDLRNNERTFPRMRERSRPPFVIVLAASLATLACRPEGSAAPIDLTNISGPAVIFDDVRVFDGVDNLGIVDVVVEGETITQIGTVDLASLPPAADVTVIEGNGGLTLLPGLIDAHAHISSSHDLARAMTYGVTTVLDQFMDERTMGMIKRQQAKGRLLDHADLRSAGILATAPEGHGTEYGVEIPTIASAAEAPGWVADRIEAGVDWIKISYDDGRAFDRPFGNFDPATLEAVIVAAHERGKIAVVHVSDLEAGRKAAELGADGLAHVFFDAEADDAFVALAVERELFITDTLVVVHAACGDGALLEAASQPALLALTDPAQLAQMRVSLAAARSANAGRLSCGLADESVLRLHQAGVDLLASTDAPNFSLGHGLAMHLELGVLVGAGLSPSEALRAATEAPARRFGLDDRGRIAPGRRADLLLVNGDPTVDIRVTGSIVGVWKAGHRRDIEARRAAVAERRAEFDALRTAPAPVGAESGLISDFDDGTLSARFGAGWVASTDAMVGGNSTATLIAADGGASGSTGSMHVAGRVAEHGGSRWAGVTFTAGSELGKAANLSRFESLEFEVRGKPGRYALMIFTTSLGLMPAVHVFELAGEDQWITVSSELGELGLEGWDIASVFIGAVDVGEFELWVDDVRFR